MRTIEQAIEFGQRAAEYQRLRAFGMRAITAHAYAAHGHESGLSAEQFACGYEGGHSWSYTGTAYGGDDESFHGEGRCYCCLCGADGDA